MNSPYAYLLTEHIGNRSCPPRVFTWPNCVKKYLRDTYAVDGELHLPPSSRLSLTRHKVNLKSGAPDHVARLDIESFLDA